MERRPPLPPNGSAPSPRVLMAAGGTGGHIFPALAVAEELRGRGKDQERGDSASAVRVAALGFEETAHFYPSKGCVTGHPVRKAFYEVRAKEHVPPYTLLILGGSQGSAAINQCVVESLPLFASQRPPVVFIHQTGER